MALSTPVALLGLAIVLAYPALAVARRNRTIEDPGWPDIRRSIARQWAFSLAILALVALAGGPADVAFRRPPSLAEGLLYGFIAFGGTMALIGLLGRRTGGMAATELTLASLELSLGRTYLLAFSVAFTESVLFYGYLIETLAGLGVPLLAAGALAGLCAALTRARGGPRVVGQWLPGALALAGVAVWTRSIMVVLPVLFFYNGLTTLSASPEDYASEA
jgi:hypothetical protein